MTLNIGEEIVAAYLQYIKGCEFIQQNLYTAEVQGEIDVVGIDLESRTIYVCEVAIHLITGLQYVKLGQPNNANKITEKFSRDIEYTNKYFPEYTKHFMLWSPIVRVSSEKAKFSQMADIEAITANITARYGVTLECIINERFADCLAELREYARITTKELKSPVLRFMQVEEYLKKHLGKISKTARKNIKNAQPDWRWEEGEVDERGEHIELRYGNAGEIPYENWEPIARIAKPKRHVFAVEWLVPQDSLEHQAMLADARKELDFYLVELNKPDPWAYALYHCNTGSNMYSRVHWSYFPTGSQGKRHASEVIQLSAEEYEKLNREHGESGKFIKKT